jgi:hypothetical protein
MNGVEVELNSNLNGRTERGRMTECVARWTNTLL